MQVVQGLYRQQAGWVQGRGVPRAGYGAVVLCNLCVMKWRALQTIKAEQRGFA